MLVTCMLLTLMLASCAEVSGDGSRTARRAVSVLRSLLAKVRVAGGIQCGCRNPTRKDVTMTLMGRWRLVRMDHWDRATDDEQERR